MANKNKTVIKDRKKKKKKNCCCSCLISMLVIFVIILGGSIGAGWFFGDMYTKQYLDMSLADVIGVYRDFRNIEEKDMDLKTFSVQDRVSFENKLKEQLFLKSSTELDLSNIISNIDFGSGSSTGKDSETEPTKEINSSTALTTSVKNSDNGNENEDENNEEDSSSTDPWMQMLADIMKKENIDVDALRQYPIEGKDYRIAITDKELAAFLNEIYVLKFKEQLNDIDIGMDIGDLSDYIGFEQIKIFGTEAAPKLKITLSVSLTKLATELVKSFTPTRLDFIVNFLLPEKLFISVDANLTGDKGIEIWVNNLNQEKNDRMFKLINKVLGFADMDLEKTLADINKDTVVPIIEKLNEHMKFDNINQSKLTLNLLDTAISATEQNIALDSNDIYFALKYTLASVYEVNAVATWKDQYENINDPDDVVYRPGYFDDENYKKIDYQDKFLSELEDKYLLDLGEGDDRLTFDDVVSLLGVGDTDKDIMDYIDTDKVLVQARDYGKDISLKISDRMLGVIFDSQLQGLIDGEGSMGSMSPSVTHIIIYDKVIDGIPHQYMEAAISINISSLLEDAGGVSGILQNIVPDSMMLTIALDITKKSTLGENEYGESSIKYNDLTGEQTKHFLDIMEKVGIEMSQDQILSQVEAPLRDAIETMYDVMPGMVIVSSPKELNNGYISGDSGIDADDIFSIIAAQVSKLSTSGEEMTGDELRSIIVELGVSESAIDYEETIQLVEASDSYENFMADLKDKYYIKDDNNEITTYKDIMDIADFNNFNTENFNIQGRENPTSAEDIEYSKKSMIYDTRTVEQLMPFFEDRELAALVLEEVNKDGSNIPESFRNIRQFKLLPINSEGESVNKSSDAYAEIIVCISKEAFAGDSEQYLSMFPVDYIYVTLSFIISENEEHWGEDEGEKYYNVDIKINDMKNGDDEFESLLKLLRLTNDGKLPIDFDAVSIDIGKILYSQLNVITENTGGSLEFITISDGDSTKSGISLTSFYDFLDEVKDGLDTDGENTKKALQGLYERNDIGGHINLDNYLYSSIVSNPVSDNNSQTETLHFDDNYIGYMFAGGDNDYGISSLSSEGFEIVQYNVIADLSLNSDFKTRWESMDTTTDEYGNALGIVLENNVTYIEVTFKMDTTFEDDDSTTKDLMPSEIYFTALIMYDESADAGEKYSPVQWISDFDEDGNPIYLSAWQLNSLTRREQRVIVNLTGFKTQDVSDKIDSVVQNFKSLEDKLEYPSDHIVKINLGIPG